MSWAQMTLDSQSAMLSVQESNLPWALPKAAISLNLRDLLSNVGGGSKV